MKQNKRFSNVHVAVAQVAAAVGDMKEIATNEYAYTLRVDGFISRQLNVCASGNDFWVGTIHFDSRSGNPSGEIIEGRHFAPGEVESAIVYAKTNKVCGLPMATTEKGTKLKTEEPPWFAALLVRDWKTIVEMAGLTWPESSLKHWAAFSEAEQKALTVAAETLARQKQMPNEVLHNVPREGIRSIMMQDIVGEYAVPEEIPEWSWIEGNASFHHVRNGQDGIWEFILNLSKTFDDIPERINSVVEAARADQVTYLMFHQGT